MSRSRLSRCALLLFVAAPLFAEVPLRYAVTLRPGLARGIARELRRGGDAANLRDYANIDAFAADMTAAEAAALRARPGVVSVQPLVLREIASVDGAEATDLSSSTQSMPWGITSIHAPEVWAATRGANVNVAIVDTGIDYNHPELHDAYAGGANMLEPAKPPLDDHLHGTHVAGTIAAADNDIGVVGVAPGVRLWAVKVLDAAGRGTDESVSAGIDWVVSKEREIGGRWVINMSLGSTAPSQIEETAVERAIADGIVVVAAAGNENQPHMSYPAAHPGVIAVGAMTSDHQRASFSSYGSGLAVVAPGEGVRSTIADGTRTSADVLVKQSLLAGHGLVGSPIGTVSGEFADCGFGTPEQIAAAKVRGKVAVIERGEIAFREKAKNAKEAGAIAVVIYNDDDTHDDVSAWTLMYGVCNGYLCTGGPEWDNYQFPLTVGISNALGRMLMARLTATGTVGYRYDAYASLSGTSMATPHVAGTAALLLALDPTLTPGEIRFVVEHTADDVVATGAGWDFETSFGEVNALTAAEYVAPAAFGMTQPPPITAPRRRSTHH